MRLRNCRICNNKYGKHDDRNAGTAPDPDWSPKDGRCYACFLGFCYEIYGGWMEPVFFVGDMAYMASGPMSKAALLQPDEGGDIPF